MDVLCKSFGKQTAEEFIIQSINLSINILAVDWFLQFNASYMDNTWQWLEGPRHKGVIRKFLNKLLTKFAFSNKITKNIINCKLPTKSWKHSNFITEIFNHLQLKFLFVSTKVNISLVEWIAKLTIWSSLVDSLRDIGCARRRSTCRIF